MTAALRELLKNDVEWSWWPKHEAALRCLKDLLCGEPVLTFYCADKPVTVRCYASSYGMGACLLQEGRPIACVSRSLKSAEPNYAQIEKELLAICFSKERFHHYVYGRKVTVQSDHRPLESIIKKPIYKASPRLQLMLLRLMKYTVIIIFTPGKDMHIAGALSPATVDSSTGDNDAYIEEAELRVHSVVAHLLMNKQLHAEILEATNKDRVLQALIDQFKKGWPEHKIYEAQGIVFVGDKLLVLKELRPYMLQKIHETHLGMKKCKSRACEIMYWPGMSRDMEEIVSRCKVCAKYQSNNQREPMIPHEVPNRPWSKLGADIFTYGSNDYLVVVDYFSKYPEVVSLPDKTAATVIRKLEAIFSRHGVPDVFMSDNMPFASGEMKQFVNEWGFKLITSSPTYPRINGLSERYFQTVKQLLRKAHDEGKSPHRALLDYRTSLVAGMKYSPAQLLMSRRHKGTLLQPEVVVGAKHQLEDRQQKQERYYNRGRKDLTEVHPGSGIRIRQGRTWEPAVVLQDHGALGYEYRRPGIS